MRICSIIIFHLVSCEKPSSLYCVILYFWGGCKGNLKLITLGSERAGVALTQISAYGTRTKSSCTQNHMEMMRTTYAKSGIRSQHVSNYTWGKRSRKARIVWEQHFSIPLNRVMVVKVLLKCSIHFSISLVRISEFLYENSRPLAYSVRISWKASATAEGLR